MRVEDWIRLHESYAQFTRLESSLLRVSSMNFYELEHSSDNIIKIKVYIVFNDWSYNLTTQRLYMWFKQLRNKINHGLIVVETIQNGGSLNWWQILMEI